MSEVGGAEGERRQRGLVDGEDGGGGVEGEEAKLAVGRGGGEEERVAVPGGGGELGSDGGAVVGVDAEEVGGDAEGGAGEGKSERPAIRAREEQRQEGEQSRRRPRHLRCSPPINFDLTCEGRREKTREGRQLGN